MFPFTVNILQLSICSTVSGSKSETKALVSKGHLFSFELMLMCFWICCRAFLFVAVPFGIATFWFSAIISHCYYELLFANKQKRRHHPCLGWTTEQLTHTVRCLSRSPPPVDVSVKPWSLLLLPPKMQLRITHQSRLHRKWWTEWLSYPSMQLGFLGSFSD